MGMMTRRNVKQRAVKKAVPAVAEVKKEDFPQNVNMANEFSEVTYTKTEINRMSTADLKKLASENGIDDSLSGAEIKKEIISKFGL